jgi:hypothetical protein
LTGARKDIMEENRYLKLKFSEGIQLFVISCLCFLLEHAKFLFIYLLHSNDDQEKNAIIHPPLKIAHAYPHSIDDLDKIVTTRPCYDHDQFNKPHKAKADAYSPVSMSFRAQLRYIPLKLPQVLHDFSLNYHEYLPMFDGETDVISAEKHIQWFEHFIYLFEIDHDDVCMISFSQSFKGNTKDWFRHLWPDTISSWEELKNIFLKFWGKKKSLELQLAKFYALKWQNNEAMSMFSRRFSSIYYKLPEEIQTTEATAMFHYTTTLHPDLSFLFMERIPKSLKQMFDDA